MVIPALFYASQRTVVSFFNKRAGEQLWKSQTSTSKQGKMSGRAKHIPRPKDLNRGQRIGVGKFSTVYPGLNVQPFSQRKLLEQQIKGPDPQLDARIAEIRDQIRKRRRIRFKGLEKGWAGDRIAGRKLGPPAPTGDETFEGYNTVILNMRMLSQFKGGPNRTRIQQCLMAAGNGDGLVGIAQAKALELKSVIRMAQNAAVRRLEYVHRLDDHSIYHDFFAECGNTRIFATRCPKGTGLRCHRALLTVCELAGIKDIHCQVEGSTTNYYALVKAFLTGLRSQETFQELAERKRLHVVEFDSAHLYAPVVRASPKFASVRTDAEIDSNEPLDVDEVYGEGRYPRRRNPRKPIYWADPGHLRSIWVKHPFRNHETVKVRLLADGVVPDLSFESIWAWSKQRHEEVLQGKRDVPVGLSLSPVTRDKLED